VPDSTSTVICSLESERERDGSHLTKSSKNNWFLRRWTCDWKPPISWDFRWIFRKETTSCSRILICTWPIAEYSSRVSTRVYRYPIILNTTALLYSGNSPE